MAQILKTLKLGKKLNTPSFLNPSLVSVKYLFSIMIDVQHQSDPQIFVKLGYLKVLFLNIL